MECQDDIAVESSADPWIFWERSWHLPSAFLSIPAQSKRCMHRVRFLVCEGLEIGLFAVERWRPAGRL